MKQVDLPSNKSFGILFGAILLLLAATLVAKGQLAGASLALAAGAGMLVLAYFSANRLAPFNRAWFALGMMLSRVVNPIVLGLLFFVMITPLALLMRAGRRDALRLRVDRSQKSYWIERDPPGPTAESLERQF